MGRVEGNWKQLKGQVQAQWGKLTDDDLDFVKGKRTELAGKLQERYGIAKDEADKQIDTWLSTAATEVYRLLPVAVRRRPAKDK